MSTEREQAIPEGAAVMRPHLTEAQGLEEVDPDLYRSLQTVLGALRQDMVPAQHQEELFQAMNAAVKRNLIAEASGLDASILTTFKQQLTLVDSILRRTFNSDGTPALGQEDIGISPKDVLNLSIKVSQMMIRELPKVYSMDRVQKMETALLKTMSEHLSRDQQEAFLAALDSQKEGV